MQKRNRSVEKKSGRAVVPAVAGLVCGLLTALLLFSILASILCKIDVPAPMLTLLATVAAALSTIPASLVFAFLYGERGMLYGLLIGALFFIAVVAAAWIQGQTAFTALSAIKAIAMLISGAIGGLLGISVREKRRRVH